MPDSNGISFVLDINSAKMGQAWPKRVCQSNSVGIWFMKTSIGFLYLFTIIELDSNGIIGLDSNGIEITSKLELVMMYIRKRIIFIGNTNGIIVFDSYGIIKLDLNGIFIFETDHEIRDRSDITTIYGGLGPSIVIIAITPESIANRNRSDIRSTGSFDQPCIYTVTDTLKSGDVVIPMGLDNSSLISVNSDRSHKRVAQNISIIELQYATRTDEGPDHFWSSNRNFNEVNYAFQHSIDDKSRVLFDEPIVWPATQLVPTMDQMLAGPGTK